MLLFGISFLLVVISSYLITSVFAPRKYGIGFLYLLLTAFAQVVLSFEVLSLFSKITPAGVLVMNGLIFLGAVVFWFKKNRPFYVPDILEFLKELFKVLKRDKVLVAITCGFVFFLCIAIIMNTFLAINSFDALGYHLSRAAFWVGNQNLLHFDIPDDRFLAFPINSELLYSWILVFMKDDWGIGYFSFFAYLASCTVLYNSLKFFGFVKRKALWSVFIFGALASVLSQATSSETDLLIGALVFASVFLFIFAVKNDDKPAIFFASLAYALAIGTKTPAIFAIPACAFIMAFFAYKYKGKEFHKPILMFLAFGLLNFILFASFNYILNLINYGSLIGAYSTINTHKFTGGFPAFVSNYIKYLFMFFDFSGYRYGEYIGMDIVNFRNAIISSLGIDHNVGVIVPEIEAIIKETLDVKMGAGLLGFLVYLPCVVFALFKLIFCGLKKLKNNTFKIPDKTLILGVFAVAFFINLAVLSMSLGYMIFSIRFITFFMIVSSPILVLSYIKRTGVLKLFLLFILLSYYVLISGNLTGKPFIYLMQIYNENGKNIHFLREKHRCSDTLAYDSGSPFCVLKINILKNIPKGSRIGIIPSIDSRLFLVKMLEKQGYKIDSLLVEKIDSYAIEKYDYIILTNELQTSAMVMNFPEGLKNYYVAPNGMITFYKDVNAMCVYHSTKDKILVEAPNRDPKMMPGAIRCKLADKFLDANHFKLVDKIKIETKFEQNNNVFKIYMRQP